MILFTITPTGSLTADHAGTRYEAPDWTTLCRTLAAVGVPDQPWEARRLSGKLIRAGRSVYASAGGDP